MSESKHTRRPVRISSRKVNARNGRVRHDFAGDFHSDEFGVVFSCGALILNLTDGKRNWRVAFDEAATAALAQRFAKRIADAMLAARAKPAAADPRDALIAELVAKLGEAREAIAAVDEWAVGGVIVEHPDGAGISYQYPVRDEVLANIDAALAKAKAEIAP